MENFSKRLDEWSIFEEGFDKEKQLISESIFSLGNAAMGQRANFEESYTGKTFRGSYIAGVYYPDRTKVGWWKNGYPEYFAKVLNAPNWIGIDIEINGENLDLNNAKEISNFSRELNMKEGFLKRSFEAELQNGSRIKVNVIRFLSMKRDELGAVRYEITPIENSAKIVFKSYVDANIKNRDSNWDEIFWEVPDSGSKDDFGFVRTRTYKTNFEVMTYMQSSIFQNGKKLNLTAEKKISEKKVSHFYTVETEAGNS
ncbi:MAG: glycoside hydrolase family 65 protein, partial [Flavobacteriia bacterium]|nr:glycoside hydrolase family 65 protein [Flavobacteriia bacterium]